MLPRPDPRAASSALAILALVALQACCQAPPTWENIDPITVADGVSVPISLSAFATGEELTFEVSAEAGVVTELEGTTLRVSGAEDFQGYAKITLSARDRCGQEATTNVSVEVSNRKRSDDCVVRLTAESTTSSVAVAGEWNDWSTTAEPMEKQADGTWAIDLLLPEGNYAYKLVHGGNDWRCDPQEPRIVCTEGQTWEPSCPASGTSCNSMLVVRDCDTPELSTSRVAIDPDTRGIEVAGKADRTVSNPWATLDGEPVEAWSGDSFSYAASGLSAGRHTLRFGADDAEPVYVPFWLDDRSWATGLMYFVFVDRFFNGSSENDRSEGATVDYAGGDFAGVTEKLDYLDELGVTVLWLTAPLDNAENAWDGQCDTNYAGYHGYWPDSSGVEEHFGTEEELAILIQEAHARNMRVMVDWVANHVHEEHDDYQTRDEWFNDEYLCVSDEDGDGVLNWDQRPETCWFAEYLPDYDYTQTEVLARNVDAAIAFAKEWEIDGYRIDAVKHMPHSVYVNSQVRILEEIEHADAGGTEAFHTVGETFDGYERIAAYIGPGELDAQFDFPLYYSIVQAFARSEIGLSNGSGSLASSAATSATAYGGALMSPFLGNHDVSRFIAHASGEVASLGGDSACGDDGFLRTPDAPPSSDAPYARLRLAWSFLLSQPGLPLIYYGDEIGLPGYTDPDNRQLMRFGSDLSSSEAATLGHVQALGQARRDHPALALGTTVGWWENEADFWAYARSYQDDHVLVLLNRAESERVVQNGLAFAGLPQGTWRDVLTGDRFTSSGDSLTVAVPAMGSRVLVAE